MFKKKETLDVGVRVKKNKKMDWRVKMCVEPVCVRESIILVV